MVILQSNLSTTLKVGFLIIEALCHINILARLNNLSSFNSFVMLQFMWSLRLKKILKVESFIFLLRNSNARMPKEIIAIEI